MSKLRSLKDIGIELIDGDRGDNYPKADEILDNGDCLFLGAHNISQNGFDFDKTQFILKEKDSTLRKGKLQRNDLVLMTRGTWGNGGAVGNIALYDSNVPFDNIRINSVMLILRCNDKFSPEMLYYLFHSNIVKSQIDNIITGSVQHQLTAAVIGDLLVPVDVIPKLDILRAINKKINNNSKIISTLESMAKTLYDYYFVQFDFPDENGRPYKTSGGKMEWNAELGREIPAGWSVCSLSKYITVCNGKDHSKLSDGMYPVYGSGGLMRKVDSYLYDGEAVLIPRKGTLNNVMYVNERFWTVDTMFYCKMNDEHIARYVYQTVCLFDFEKLNTGSALPSMTASIINGLLIPDAPYSQILKYDRIVNKMFVIIRRLQVENERLASLRDFLLPMLMNGQITFA